MELTAVFKNETRPISRLFQLGLVASIFLSVSACKSVEARHRQLHVRLMTMIADETLRSAQDVETAALQRLRGKIDTSLIDRAVRVRIPHARGDAFLFARPDPWLPPEGSYGIHYFDYSETLGRDAVAHFGPPLVESEGRKYWLLDTGTIEIEEKMDIRMSDFRFYPAPF